jgi:hypothetical protein
MVTLRRQQSSLLSLGIDIARWYRVGGRPSAERVASGYAELAMRVVGAAQPPL